MSELKHHSIDSSIILLTLPFHLHHHSSIVSPLFRHHHSSIASPLCRHHRSSRPITDMMPPVIGGHKLTPRNVEQAYTESSFTNILLQLSTRSQDVWGINWIRAGCLCVLYNNPLFNIQPCLQISGLLPMLEILNAVPNGITTAVDGIGSESPFFCTLMNPNNEHSYPPYQRCKLRHHGVS